MKSIRIENLRSLKDTNNIDLKSLNVLVGKNSSGKSTFLRFFPLLKQTFETNTNEPILWYTNRMVDFGSFDESINIDNKDDTINFSFKLDISDFKLNSRLLGLSSFFRFTINKDGKNKKEVDLNIKIGNKFITEININVEDILFELKFNLDKSFTITIDQKDISELTGLSNNYNFEWIKNKNSIFPLLFLKEAKRDKKDKNIEEAINFEIVFREKFSENFKSMVIEALREQEREEIFDELVNYVIGTTVFENYDSWKIDIINNIKSEYKKSKPITKSLKKSEEEFSKLYYIFVTMHISSILESIDRNLKSFFTNVHYIAPLRASAERYYRLQGISVDEVDPLGTNIPMLLHNMKETDGDSFIKWKKWTKENFDLEFESDNSTGQTSLKISTGTNKGFNMSDTGFGFSQILPILLLIWKIKEQKNNKKEKKDSFLRSFYINDNEEDNEITIIIEQPELHLHPAMQSKLLDTFANIIKKTDSQIKLRFIIETHSETIINRIGYQIDIKKNLNPEDVNILIFENEISPYNTKINRANFNGTGVLSNWPIGFFGPEIDEAEFESKHNFDNLFGKNKEEK